MREETSRDIEAKRKDKSGRKKEEEIPWSFDFDEICLNENNETMKNTG